MRQFATACVIFFRKERRYCYCSWKISSLQQLAILIACYCPPLVVGTGYLTSNQKVLICTTHIKKVVDKLYSFSQRSKITDKHQQIRSLLDSGMNPNLNPRLFTLKSTNISVCFRGISRLPSVSSFCDDSNLHISLFKYVLSTMGVSKESISKFLIGNRFHVKLRILSVAAQTNACYNSNNKH